MTQSIKSQSIVLDLHAGANYNFVGLEQGSFANSIFQSSNLVGFSYSLGLSYQPKSTPNLKFRLGFASLGGWTGVILKHEGARLLSSSSSSDYHFELDAFAIPWRKNKWDFEVGAGLFYVDVKHRFQPLKSKIGDITLIKESFNNYTTPLPGLKFSIKPTLNVRRWQYALCLTQYFNLSKLSDATYYGKTPEGEETNTVIDWGRTTVLYIVISRRIFKSKKK